ncbi:hypothetical protein G5V59_23860 [Nocardioides sp. W3-2-3]|uniref:hypothetical protein n=1 Tax=Nocardioides convexus TaxID=2712224 RepID=UPI0024188D59|nr:hypothetical protein [Nocardioides convexus]NHA01726.1 hypothetical protein [Nocardioides convexus]
MATTNAAREPPRGDRDRGPGRARVGAADRLRAAWRAWSPETVRMVPLKPGGLRVGQWYLGINRRKAAVWPTRSVVAAVVPGRQAGVGHPVERRAVGVGAWSRWRGRPAGPGSCTADRCRGGSASAAGSWRRCCSAAPRGTPTSLERGMAATVAGLKAAAEG